MTDYRIEIFADGGCEGNGVANAQCYGSFVLKALRLGTQDILKEKHSGRIDYPQHHTNNSAEIQVIMDALGSLKAHDGPVTVYSDSQIAVNILSGKWKAKADHLRVLAYEARQLCQQFPQLELIWVPRERIALELGH